MANTTAKTVQTTWEVWTYDVWGNREDGFEVNDRRCLSRAYPIRCKVQTFNIGTPNEFTSASPSDYQLQQVFGVRCALDTDGDDLTIYVNRASDSYPLGELHCTSHASLSAIRVNTLVGA